MRVELEVEPFFQAGAAEGVQAVEEGERLVEDFRAYLISRTITLAYEMDHETKAPCERERCLAAHPPPVLSGKATTLYSSFKKYWGPAYRARQLLLQIQATVLRLHGDEWIAAFPQLSGYRFRFWKMGTAWGEDRFHGWAGARRGDGCGVLLR